MKGPAKDAPWRVQRWFHEIDPSYSSPISAGLLVGYLSVLLLMISPTDNWESKVRASALVFLLAWAHVHLFRDDRWMTKEERLEQEIIYFTPFHPPAVEKWHHLFWPVGGAAASVWLVRQGLAQMSTAGVTVPRVALTLWGLALVMIAVSVLVKSLKERPWST